MHTDAAFRYISTGLSAITSDRFKPAAGTFRIKRPGAVVLCAAEEIVQRILQIYREALELQCHQSVIHAEDLRRDGGQPHPAVGEVRTCYPAVVAIGRCICKRSAGAHNTTV